MFSRRVAVPAFGLLAAVLSVAAPASAAGGLAPGGGETISVPLPRAWATQANQLGVSVVELVQSENACLAPERAAGDTTCGEADGDLAAQLVARVGAGTLENGNCHPAGALVPLDLLRSRAQARLRVSDASCLAIRLRFPSGEDDNLAQSDGITFFVRTVAEGPGSGVTGGTQDSLGRTAGGRLAGSDSASIAGVPAGRVPAGTADTSTSGTTSSSAVVGEQTTPVQVNGDTDTVAVRTESSTRSIAALALAWGSMFLGVVVLGLVFFLWWRRRRRGVSS